MNTLADRLIFARERKGKIWTQKHLAIVAGVSTGTIGMLESGKRGNTGSIPGTIPQIAKALGVRFDWLAYGEGQIDEEPDIAGPLTAVASMEDVLQLQVTQLAILLNSIPKSSRDAAYTAASQALIAFLPGASPKK